MNSDQDVVQGGGEYMGYEHILDHNFYRKPLQKSGKDFTIMKVLPSGVYQYRFLVDGQRRYSPGLKAATRGTRNEAARVIQPPAPRFATQAAPTGRRPSTLQPPGSRTATQQQVGYFGPINEALLRNVGSASTQAGYSILANRRYTKRPTIDQILEKMKERSKRRQQE
ncbi:UNVERIFIED_CONTAM: SNF1-related protein kinase regulatory subunit beta-2 [Sesamum latifolium]|uniref:SNF1-related protein kinase regulatory subunit beta-2 n=1 Tax=Sesamum latifolium TaxID=2727402 RepID=A0AAW2U4A4_9LAMI